MNTIYSNPNVPGEVQHRPNRVLSFFMNFLLPLAALACGIAITWYLLQTGPEAKPKKRPPSSTLVEVMTVQAAPQQTFINAMGEIIPSQEVEVKPRVSGEVLEANPEFLPGGHFRSGETMLRIDRTDYELAAEQLASQALQAKSDLALEMGNQRIASRELTLMGESVSQEEKALILREPQLEKLQAASRYAESKLARARLDLERTEIKAPFNGVVSNRGVVTGARVTESTVLATLVGTDAFWLRLTLPVSQLDWVHIPENRDDQGSIVHIYPQSGKNDDTYRTGEVIRLDAALETQGRMARLLVEIKDPLSLSEENKGKPRLLLGSYVKAEIEGIPVNSGIKLNRAHLHDNDTVWLMDEDGRLEVRPVKVLFRAQDHVILDDSINNGEKIITSSMSSPVPGILLRLEGDTPKTPGMKGMAKGTGGQKNAE
ncbi:efflux RND transporter periplasmic adaptor subunit [Desulfopila sp. IMCC35008]|uniref:efflux RND transporter periplasmic adaptor subunit n=1 Tax=Desulfopila sp. IMCC35008 TaxID=2653858 RepID=UPI0013D17E7E|nr:efflux RND transporter periplasmic adaptor subunit [Desulfopila sp. IMCC35008]